ncbi:MAG TPA: PEP-CTERM sorting domain-containing protein [Rhizomicrobium sp.]|nr:PEP-CTERM sorting domain-containing protein [Rhizomicrobium sp.]
MRNLMVGLLAGSAMLAAAGAAQAAPVVMLDGFVKAGVNDYGTLGSIGATSPGILYDATGTGAYGINDFLTPGDPFEGYYVKATGYSNGANNDGVTGFGTSAPVSVDATHATWSGTDGTLNIANAYSLSTIAGRSVIAVTTTLTNISNSTLTSLAFERILDPDVDVNAFGSFVTSNILFGTGEACGTGNFSGETICITENDPTHTGVAKVTASWSTDPYTILLGGNDGNGDYSIALAFALGDLAAGASDTFSYFYALGADRGTASGGDVPEPLTMSLFGAGLLGAGVLRRRMKKAQA